MKKLSLLFILMTLAIFAGCRRGTQPVKEIEYVLVKDTADSVQYMTTIINLNYKIKLYEDSICMLNSRIDLLDSTKAVLQEDNIAAKYKLERIAYYNRIAANGNNIKYLRGWINRVLN